MRPPQDDAPGRHTEGVRNIIATEQLTPTRTSSDSDGMSISVPAHPLHPAEADLRFTTNTIVRDPVHWWLRTAAGAPQLAFLQGMGWVA